MEQTVGTTVTFPASVFMPEKKSPFNITLPMCRRQWHRKQPMMSVSARCNLLSLPAPSAATKSLPKMNLENLRKPDLEIIPSLRSIFLVANIGDKINILGTGFAGNDEVAVNLHGIISRLRLFLTGVLFCRFLCPCD